MPVHSDTNGMGAQMPTEKYGVRSPFHAGGGGGGGGGSGAATQVLDGGSNTVPDPQSAALLTPVETTVTRVSGANVAAAIIAKDEFCPPSRASRRILPTLLRDFTPSALRVSPELTIAKPPRWRVDSYA